LHSLLKTIVGRVSRLKAGHSGKSFVAGLPVAAAADRLIECALDQNARDNVSVVVVEYAR